jgi:hypothetical protein
MTGIWSRLSYVWLHLQLAWPLTGDSSLLFPAERSGVELVHVVEVLELGLVKSAEKYYSILIRH